MRSRRARVSLLAAAAALVALAGCSASAAGGATKPTESAGGTGNPSHPAAKPHHPTIPRATLTISPADGSRDIRPDAPVTVTATSGKLRSVVVRSEADAVTGAFNADHTSWQSRVPMNVGEAYSVAASAVNPAGAITTATSAFHTLTPTQSYQVSISEAAGATYGVGMPIQLTFSAPVTNRVAVERSLSLVTSKPVVGAWYWLDDEHLNFRPRDYWPQNTRVSVIGRFNGVPASPGVYGSADLSESFVIGQSVIVTASTTTHHLQVYVGGRLRYDWPISTGRPGHDTPNGTYVTIDKGNPVEMKPSDIAPGQPGYYDLMVPWSVRFTWSGIFLHDAYWSVAEQGYVNVSHGCVNMPPAAAETYYEMEVPGDPVTVTGSPLAGAPGDGWTDWFLSWPDLLANSALHRAVEAGPHGSRLVAPSAVAPSPAKAPLQTAAPDNAATS